MNVFLYKVQRFTRRHSTRRLISIFDVGRQRKKGREEGKEGGGERQEALLELSRGNFVGREDKEKHQKESQCVWRGARWIKFFSSWERR